VLGAAALRGVLVSPVFVPPQAMSASALAKIMQYCSLLRVIIGSLLAE